MVSGGDEKQQTLSTDDIGGGLKEALRVGTERVVGNLGTTDGFNLDPQIHIPLPEQLDQVRKVLGKIGMDSMLVDLESGRPMEIDALVTAVQEMGSITGHATPTIDTVVSLLRQKARLLGCY